MNVANLKEQLTKLRPLVFLVSILLITYLAWFFISGLTNPSFGVLPKPVFSSQIVTKPEWATEILSLPSNRKAPVYKVIKRGFSVKEAADLAKKLKFTVTPQLLQGSVMNWTDSNQELYINLDTGEFNYRIINKKIFSVGVSVPNLSQAETETKNFLESLGVDYSQIDLPNPEVEYYKTSAQSTEYTPATSKDGNLIKLNYAKKIKGLTLSDKNGDQTLEIMLNSTNQPIYLHFNRLDIEIGKASYPLESANQVSENIKKDGAYVARFPDENSPSVNDPTKVFVSVGSLKLYDDGKGQYIEPIFVFAGLASKKGINAPVEIYYPAVSDQYLK